MQLMGPDVLTDAVVAKALLMVRNDDASNVRAEAVRLLGRSGRRDAAVLSALATTAQSDETEYVREQAREILHTDKADGSKPVAST
jgi:HEAT repeats